MAISDATHSSVVPRLPPAIQEAVWLVLAETAGDPVKTAEALLRLAFSDQFVGNRALALQASKSLMTAASRFATQAAPTALNRRISLLEDAASMADRSGEVSARVQSNFALGVAYQAKGYMSDAFTHLQLAHSLERTSQTPLGIPVLAGIEDRLAQGYQHMFAKVFQQPVSRPKRQTKPSRDKPPTIPVTYLYPLKALALSAAAPQFGLFSALSDLTKIYVQLADRHYRVGNPITATALLTNAMMISVLSGDAQQMLQSHSALLVLYAAKIEDATALEARDAAAQLIGDEKRTAEVEKIIERAAKVLMYQFKEAFVIENLFEIFAGAYHYRLRELSIAHQNLAVENPQVPDLIQRQLNIMERFLSSYHKMLVALEATFLPLNMQKQVGIAKLADTIHFDMASLVRQYDEAARVMRQHYQQVDENEVRFFFNDPIPTDRTINELARQHGVTPQTIRNVFLTSAMSHSLSISLHEKLGAWRFAQLRGRIYGNWVAESRERWDRPELRGR
ncbi:MAG: hypothetical protein COV45_05440 [Deltaproteobacteria bacterium CG11_big_fil_rev_8_21_14_0_20_47_16]|nr:MAG: hypothetical protein COV45_05440 [Deltaproteobacteria bacterium CG11_big_fil_rev_8_21_14_0_20_47_16]